MKYLTILALLISMPIYAQTKYPVPTPLPVTPAYIDTPHRPIVTATTQSKIVDPVKFFSKKEPPLSEFLEKKEPKH